MSEFFANCTKLAVCVCGIIVVAAWSFGFLKTNDLTAVMGILLTAHAGVSALNGIVGGPTRNSDIKS